MIQKKYIIGLICLLLFSVAKTNGENYKPNRQNNTISYYSSEVEEAMKAIQKLPESRAIFEKIQKDGSIQVLFKPLPSVDFGAMWDSDARTITVNSKSPRELGNVICSILFEMHNAMSNSQFIKLTDMAARGEITKDQYVEYVERMEHTNCMGTVSLLEKGIKAGIFPENARWNIYTNFDDHYKVQQLTDHSIWLGKNYDRMCKDPTKRGQIYQGTINGLFQMSNQDKKDMLYYLAIKNELESDNPQRVAKANKKLQNEYASIEDGLHGKGKAIQSSRAIQKTRLLNIVFKEDTVYATSESQNQQPG
jgi:hypothetical protein